VFQVDDSITTSTGKRMQNVVIGDGHGLAKVTLWEEDIGKLSMSKSYCLENMVIKEYRGEAYLSIAASTL